MTMKGMFAAAVGLLAVAGMAATNYVDCTLGDYAGHDGSTPALAFETIQEALDACAAGDTVLVAPGRYDKGGAAAAGENSFNRVYVSKANVTLKSTGGAAVTFIVGAHDALTAVDDYGNGPAAVRCVFVNGANGVKVEGFTLADGAAHPTEYKQNSAIANAGGLRFSSGGLTSCIVDCVVTNCSGVRGGAVYYGKAVRCRITGNNALVKGAGGFNASFANCLFDGNGGGASICVNSTAVNCTFTHNGNTYLGTEKTKFYNCISTTTRQIGEPTPEENQRVSAYNSMFTRGYTTGKTITSLFWEVENTSTNSPVYLLANPLFGDFRPLPGHGIETRGDAAHLANVAGGFGLPAGVELYRDLAGAEIGRTGGIAAGALQEVAPAPATGIIDFSSGTATVDGVKLLEEHEYVMADAWPRQFRVVANAPAAGKGLFSYRDEGPGISDGGRLVYPLMDGSSMAITPPVGDVHTNSPIYADKVYYVNPRLADYTGHDGSTPALAFKTIQAAVDDAGRTRSLILCAEGDYDSEEDVKFDGGLTNRVTISASQSFRIVGAGRDKSVIIGKKDESDPAGDGSLRGPAAIRGIYFGGGNCVVQGFTIRGGRSGLLGDGSSDTPANRGGCVLMVYNTSMAQQLADCTLDDGIAYRGGAVFGGGCERCVITGCLGYNGGIRYCRVRNSLIKDNLGGTGNQIACSFNNIIENCTVIGRGTTDEQVSTAPMTNCVVTSVRSAPSGSRWGGVYIWNVAVRNAGINADPLFIDAANGDWGLLNVSPCYGGGVIDDVRAFVNLYSPDFNSRPLAFVDGKPTVGAFQNLAYGARFVSENGVEFTPSGACTAHPGDTFSVSVDISGATRPIATLMVAGEEVDIPASGTLQVTVSSDLSVPCVVKGVFTSDWYVNPTAEDNSGNGFTPATAKRNFHGAGGIFAEGSLVDSGDTVHAAPGVYAEESGSNSYGASRVIVPAGVTLVADEGPEATIIVGAHGTDGTTLDGLGTGAIRCAYVTANGRIRDFTLTGGATLDNGSASNSYGGGALGNSDTLSYVEGCIISNNIAVRGGGTHQVRAVNCRYLGNSASQNRAAQSNGTGIGCYYSGNRGATIVQNCVGLMNCTIADDNLSLSGGATTILAYPDKYVVNTLVLGRTDITSLTVSITNSLFCGKFSDNNHLATLDETSRTGLAVADLGLDANHRPASTNSVVVDAAREDAVNMALFNGRDAALGQRVYNGRMDLGAFEYDWRPIYAADLSEKGLITCPAASGKVAESANGTVQVPAGEKLEIVLQGATGGATARCEVPLEMTGTGSLEVTLNGEPLAAYTAADGSTVLKFKSAAAENRLVFDCAGENASGVAEIGTITRRLPGFSVNFR